MSRRTVLSPPGVIYAISDPRTRRIRYIGKTCDFRKRVLDHGKELRRGIHKNARLQQWYNELVAAGHLPVYRIVQECLPGTIDECEREWIARGRAKGWRLCNWTDGGEGAPWPDELKRQQSERTRAKYQDPEYVRRFMEGQAKRFGITSEVRQHRAAKREADLEQHRQNMALSVERQRRAQEAERLWATLTPLTHKGTAFLPLTRGQWALIDTQDWERVSRHRWNAQDHHAGWRAKMNATAAQPHGLLSRFIVNAAEGEEVRFENGDTLDCRRHNLVTLQPITPCHTNGYNGRWYGMTSHQQSA